MRFSRERYQHGSVRKVARSQGFAWDFNFYITAPDGKRKLKVQTFDAANVSGRARCPHGRGGSTLRAQCRDTRGQDSGHVGHDHRPLHGGRVSYPSALHTDNKPKPD
jgi:hypothetical protein